MQFGELFLALIVKCGTISFEDFENAVEQHLFLNIEWCMMCVHVLYALE